MNIDEQYDKMTLEELADLFQTLLNTLGKIAGVMANKVQTLRDADRL